MNSDDLEGFTWIHTEFATALHAFRGGFNEAIKKSVFDKDFLTELGITESLSSWLKHWACYISFLRRRRWFYRTWVIQEAAMAQDLLFVCNRTSFQWDRLMEIAVFISASNWTAQLSPNGEKYRGISVGSEIRRIALLRDEYQSGGPQADGPSERKAISSVAFGAKTDTELWFCYLESLLFQTRGQGACDARDKIFSMLGLAKSHTPNQIEFPIQPNYDRKVEYIYTSVTTKMLQNTPTLSTLSLVEDRSKRNLRSLPSWVPDYSHSLPWTPLTYLNYSGRFDTSLTRKESGLSPTISQNTLIVSAVRVGVISQVCEPMNEILGGPYLLPALLICLALPSIYHSTSESRVEVLAKCLIADTLGTVPDNSSMKRCFHDWLVGALALNLTNSVLDTVQRDRLMHCLRLLRTQGPQQDDLVPTIREIDSAVEGIRNFQELQRSNRDIRFSILDSVGENSKYVAFSQACSRVGDNRRLFLTSCGYLGLGPRSTDLHDEVWLFHGARVPFVLRNILAENETFVLVGETYLHGIMHGENMTEQLRREMRPIHIV